MTKHVPGLKQETSWYIYGLPVVSLQLVSIQVYSAEL